MIIHYLKIAWRQLRSNKIYSAINIVGLAIGLTICMIIMLYVGHESSYDRFHEKASRIVFMQGKVKMGSDSIDNPYMSYTSGPMVKEIEPSVKSFLRLKAQWNKNIIQNPVSPAQKFREDHFLFADSNFFSFFSFNLLIGNKQTVLNNPFAVVISQLSAEKYFGHENPVGKVLRYNNKYNLIVTGVASKVPSNSSITFDFVASLSTLSFIEEEKAMVTGSQKVQGGAFTTYFLLEQPKDAYRLESTVQKLSSTGGERDTRYMAIPLVATHLQTNYGDSSNTKYLNLFPWVAALVLLLALTNYVSLSTARSSTRAKEIGVRKTMGAGRKTIAAQFFMESATYSTIAFGLAYVICTAFQPYFFHFLGIDIDTSFLHHPYIITSYLLLFVITIFLAATYPSVLLSAYKPVLVLNGKFNSKSGGIGLRKFITVFQFIISVILIFCGIVIQKQMDFFRKTNTGINRENILMIPFESMNGRHYSGFKNEVSSLSGVRGVTTAHYPMYKGTDIYFTRAKGNEREVSLPVMNVDENFISLLGIEWKIPPQDSFYMRRHNIVAINQAAITKLDLHANPVGENFEFANSKIEIGGVIKDFNFTSLHKKIDALCLFITYDTASFWEQIGGNLFAKIQPHTNLPSVIKQIKEIYEKYDNERPFEYMFMDDAFEAMYKAEDKLAKIFTVFTVFALFIACLGLFGLVTFSAKQRTKEIGIRKVLGGSVKSIVALLSKDFIKLVILAIVISSPIAWWIMNKWLENFAYKVNISFWIFLITGIAVILIAFLSVSYQAIKVGMQNPVKSLRTE